MKIFSHFKKKSDPSKNDKTEPHESKHIIRRGIYFVEGVGGGVLTITSGAVAYVFLVARIPLTIGMLQPAFLLVAPFRSLAAGCFLSAGALTGGAAAGTKRKFQRAFGKDFEKTHFFGHIKSRHPLVVFKEGVGDDFKTSLDDRYKTWLVNPLNVKLLDEYKEPDSIDDSFVKNKY